MGQVIQTGVVHRLRLSSDEGQEYFLYVPSPGGSGAPLFVTVHGISRNADVHSALYAPFAERYGVVMMAPYYPDERYPDYQNLGRTGQGERSDRMLERIVAEVARLTGANGDRLYLFGYSGGGQFVHRFAMAYPNRVARLVVGAAGWYTLPDPNLDFPQGVRQIAELPDVRIDLAAFVQVPAMVVVGEKDVERGSSLNQSPEIDARQGTTRRERGRRWAEAMRAVALEHGVTGNYTYHILPEAAHSFADCMRLGGMGATVFPFLFGDRPQ